MSILVMDDGSVAVQVQVDQGRVDLLKKLLSWHPHGRGWEWMIEFNLTMEFPDNVFLTVATDMGAISYRIGEYVVFHEGRLSRMCHDPESQHCSRVSEEDVQANPLFCVRG